VINTTKIINFFKNIFKTMLCFSSISYLVLSVQYSTSNDKAETIQTVAHQLENGEGISHKRGESVKTNTRKKNHFLSPQRHIKYLSLHFYNTNRPLTTTINTIHSSVTPQPLLMRLSNTTNCFPLPLSSTR
jgi:hypothetical protein